MTISLESPATVQCITCGTVIRSEGRRTCATHVADELGITYRQLDYWVRKGFLKPRRFGESSGISREWPPAELDVARRMGLLTAAGLVPERAHAFAREGWPSGEIAPGIRIEVTGVA